MSQQLFDWQLGNGEAHQQYGKSCQFKLSEQEAQGTQIMKHQLTALLFFISVTLPCGTSAQAQGNTIEVLAQSGLSYTHQSESGCNDIGCTFYVRGTITNQSVMDVKNFLEANKNSSLIVDFDSLGGDVQAAVELGRIIRKYVATTRLMSGACASACVISFVGGVNRTTTDKLPKFGIHTPYFSDTLSTTYENANSRFKKMSTLVTQYLQDMNIPAGLYEEMLRYPAESMHIMTNEELSRYRVIGIDASEQDRRDSNAARRYGLDKQTFLSRKQLAKIECDKYIVERPKLDNFIQYSSCHDRVMKAN